MQAPSNTSAATNTCFTLESWPDPRPRSWLLARRHPNRPVETDDLAVDHLILGDVTREGRILGGLTKPRREWDLLAERLARGFRQSCQHRRIEDAGRDARDANLMLCELARDRKRHPDDAALRCRVRGLTDLSVVSGDRCGADDDTSVFPRFDRAFEHLRRGETDHVERTDQVDRDNLCKILQRQRTVTSNHALRSGDAGAVDRSVQRAELLGRQIDRALHLSAIGDVGARENDRAAELARQLVAALADVANHDVCAGAREFRNAGCAQSGAAAAD